MCCSVLQCIADQYEVYCIAAAVHVRRRMSRMEWSPHRCGVVLRHEDVLQCVAVCCSVLQCVAVCCSVLQCVAVCCSVLQCAADQLDV